MRKTIMVIVFVVFASWFVGCFNRGPEPPINDQPWPEVELPKLCEEDQIALVIPREVDSDSWNIYTVRCIQNTS